MKTLASCAAIADVTIGVLWNGHGTQTLGAYLLLVAVVWITANALFLLAWPWLARRMRASLEREIPSREYAEWFLGDEGFDQSGPVPPTACPGGGATVRPAHAPTGPDPTSRSRA